MRIRACRLARVVKLTVRCLVSRTDRCVQRIVYRIRAANSAWYWQRRLQHASSTNLWSLTQSDRVRLDPHHRCPDDRNASYLSKLRAHCVVCQFVLVISVEMSRTHFAELWIMCQVASGWLGRWYVCVLHLGSNCSLARAMYGRIMRRGIISSCQSAATSEIVKRFTSSRVSSAIASTRPLPLSLPFSAFELTAECECTWSWTRQRLLWQLRSQAPRWRWEFSCRSADRFDHVDMLNACCSCWCRKTHQCSESPLLSLLYRVCTATSTGSRDGMSNFYRGACFHRNMKLVVRVCCDVSQYVDGQWLTLPTKNNVEFLHVNLKNKHLSTHISFKTE